MTLLLLIILTSLSLVTSIPILSDDELKLNSIVISEINLPTEASHTIVDQEITVEPVSTFLDLVEKYEGTYGSGNDENEFALQKRSSIGDVGDDDDSGKIDADAGGKSLIDKIETPDPEVRKEFENELSQNQITRDESNEDTRLNSQVATEYDPNYERKVIVLLKSDENVTEVQHNDSSTMMTVHDKENLQVHLVEQLVHHNEHRHEFTTVVPEESFTDHALVKNPEVIDVLEHIVYESDEELKIHEHSTANPVQIVEIEVDPIEIIPKDRHREAKVEAPTSDDNNDKFAGFVGIPSEDLIQPGEETTEPDNFFKKTDASSEDEDEDPIEAVRETLEYVAIYGKSLKLDDENGATEMPPTTTEEPIYETKTEIVEVNTKVTVSAKTGSDIGSEKSSSSEESSQHSSQNKSSEESEEKVNKKVKKDKKIDNDSVSSEEIESENVGKEDLSDGGLNLKSLEFPVTQRSTSLPEDVFKDTTAHEIKKKDHPDGLAVMYEVSERELTAETVKPDEIVATSTVETFTKVYEAFEEVITAVSDGIKLTKELRHHVESFRVDSEENKIVMDTHSEPLSSKNSKNPLVNVNDLEMMKLKERSFTDEPKISIAIIPLVAVVSVGVLATLYKFLKVKATVRLY